MAGRERVVEFAVKARDEYSKVLKNLEQQQTKLSAAAKASQRRATVGVAQSEVDAALANYKSLTAQVERYNKALADGRATYRLADAELDELADTIRLTRDRAREAADAYQQKQTALRALTGSVNTGYGAIDRLALSTNRVASETVEEGSAASATATQLNKLTAASKTAAAAQGTLKTKTDAANNSIRNQRSGGRNGAKGNAQDVEVFGLKPWQLTNLGYQVNDVVSGLAMGQRPLQILSQQAGQFAQIWPNAMVALARSVPIIAAVTAVIAPFAVAAKRLADTNESMRVFSADLTLSADGAKYSAEQLTKATDSMREFGLSTSDARDVVRQFVKDGIKQSDFSQITKMAKELSAITGEGVGAAAKRLSSTFSGSIDDVRKLDEELNFLTADQWESIRATAKGGDTASALSQAQEILAGKLAATKHATTDWEQAIKDLSSAWNTFIGAVQKTTVFQWMLRQVKLFGEDAKAVAGLVKSLVDGVDPLTAAQNQLAGINQQIANELEFRKATGASSGSPGMSGEDPLKSLQAQKIALEAFIQNITDGTNAFEKMGAAQASTAAQSEEDQKDIKKIIDSQVDKMADEERLATLTNRQRFIEQQVLEAKNAALAKGLKLSEDTLDVVRKQADATYSAQNPNYEAQYTAMRGTPQGSDMARLVASVSELAVSLKVNAKDLLTAISYETGGTFNPAIKGGAGGKYVGLFQASPYNQQKYGINETSSVEAQVKAMGKYLTDAGVKAGDGLLQIYAAINAGNAKNIHASDEKNGGAPGTVLDKVSDQMDQHAQKAQALIDAFDGSLAQKQAQYNEDLNERLTTAQQELDLAKQSNRQAAIAKAAREEELRAKKDGLTLSDEQLEKVKAIAAAEFDQQHANDEVNKLVAQRTALFESLQIAQTAGDQGKVDSVVQQIAGVEDKLKSAIDSAIKFWQAMGGPNADQAIADLENLRDSIGQTLAKMDKQFLPTAQEINEQLADAGANAFDAFAQAIANGENSAKALFAALRQGIAEFLIDIGKAIIKQAIFNAISGAGGSGGVGGSISSFITGLFRHDGGMAGSGGGRTALFNPAVFANATRFHSGGIAGLKPNEVPIVALKDEEILTSDDPRHRANGGLSGGQAVNLKNVNVFDPADVMQAALETIPGERVLMNWLTRNKQKVSAAISG